MPTKQPRKDTNRIDKVNSYIQAELGPILLEYLRDQGALVTITKVETSKDMKWAKVWVSILGKNADSNETDTKVFKAIEKNIYDIQGALNDKFATKIVPRLTFTLDTSPRYVQHIDELIKKIHEEEE